MPPLTVVELEAESYKSNYKNKSKILNQYNRRRQLNRQNRNYKFTESFRPGVANVYKIEDVLTNYVNCFQQNNNGLGQA